MKVLYVVTLFPCWSETFIVREIRALLAQGVDVRILSLKPASEKLVHPDAAELLERVIYPPSGWGRTLAACIAHAPQLLSVAARSVVQFWKRPQVLAKTWISAVRTYAALPEVRAFQPDHIHAHWATYSSTAAWLLARALKIEFSFTSHAHDIFVEDQFIALKLRECRFAATISEFNRHLLTQRYGAHAREKLSVVHCGVDVAEFSRFTGRREPATILAVGRFDGIKGFPVLLDALALLRKAGMTFRCTLIGDGELRPALEKQRRELGLEGVVDMPGAKPQAEVRAAMTKASVFVMPSVMTPDGNMDGIPVVLMEAMMLGTPVVGTRVSGLPEIIRDKDSGLLVNPGDAQALAAAIRQLIEDPVLAARVGEIGSRTVVNEFNASAEAGKLRTLFAECIDARAVASTAASPRGAVNS